MVVEAAVECFVFSRWNITDRLKKALVINPPDPLKCGEFDVFKFTPRAALADDLRLVKTDYCSASAQMLLYLSSRTGQFFGITDVDLGRKRKTSLAT